MNADKKNISEWTRVTKIPRMNEGKTSVVLSRNTCWTSTMKSGNPNNRQGASSSYTLPAPPPPFPLVRRPRWTPTPENLIYSSPIAVSLFISDAHHSYARWKKWTLFCNVEWRRKSVLYSEEPVEVWVLMDAISFSIPVVSLLAWLSQLTPQ